MTSKQIFNEVTAITGFGKVILRSRSRSRSFVRARAFFAIIAKAHGMSYPEIAALLDRDHTSIMNQIKKFKTDSVIGSWILLLGDPLVDQHFAGI